MNVERENLVEMLKKKDEMGRSVYGGHPTPFIPTLTLVDISYTHKSIPPLSAQLPNAGSPEFYFEEGVHSFSNRNLTNTGSFVFAYSWPLTSGPLVTIQGACRDGNLRGQCAPAIT